MQIDKFRGIFPYAFLDNEPAKSKITSTEESNSGIVGRQVCLYS